MKKFFSAVAFSISSFFRKHKNSIFMFSLVITLIVTFIIGYMLADWLQSKNMPTQESYEAYKNIIQQIADGKLAQLEIPDNTTVSISDFNGIVVRNTVSLYSVTGKCRNGEWEFENSLDWSEQFDSKLVAGLSVMFFGSLCIFALVIILYYIFKFLSWVVACLKNIFSELYVSYKKKRNELIAAEQEDILAAIEQENET